MCVSSWGVPFCMRCSVWGSRGTFWRTSGTVLRVILVFVGWVDSGPWKVPGRKITPTVSQFAAPPRGLVIRAIRLWSTAHSWSHGRRGLASCGGDSCTGRWAWRGPSEALCLSDVIQSRKLHKTGVCEGGTQVRGRDGAGRWEGLPPDLP